MPVGLQEPTSALPVPGVQLAAVASGIRYQGRDDLLVIKLETGATVGAVFTANRFRAAPVVVAEEHLAECAPRLLVVNAGNANAGTGREGMETARKSCECVARQFDVAPESVLPFSTGVIGEPLPVERICSALPRAEAGLRDDGWLAGARAIMTTDTVPKLVSRQLEIDGATVTLTGMAKGAGMICPDMATMLAFIATDAWLDQALVQRSLKEAVAGSFNAISVDGDTSTNDACVVMSTGLSGVRLKDSDDPRCRAFQIALNEVCVQLAQSIVRDAEGATRFVTIRVISAPSQDAARRIAYTTAHSPLVKTAFFAGDPNWGRILAAVGRSGVALSVDKVQIFLDDVRIVERGGRDSNYREESGAAVMSRPEFTVTIALNQGSHEATVWTSDLSHDYVRINAEYRT